MINIIPFRYVPFYHAFMQGIGRHFTISLIHSERPFYISCKMAFFFSAWLNVIGIHQSLIKVWNVKAILILKTLMNSVEEGNHAIMWPQFTWLGYLPISANQLSDLSHALINSLPDFSLILIRNFQTSQSALRFLLHWSWEIPVPRFHSISFAWNPWVSQSTIRYLLHRDLWPILHRDDAGALRIQGCQINQKLGRVILVMDHQIC